MYYIRTADKLMRTARWLEGMEGGIEVRLSRVLCYGLGLQLGSRRTSTLCQKLRKVILDDELGICADLEREMDDLVGTYFDEWRAVVSDPERQKQFRQFVNTKDRVAQTEKITERGQMRPANWSKAAPPLVMRESDVATPKSEWKWRRLAAVGDLVHTDGGTTSAAVRYGDSQIAIYHIPHRGYFATQQVRIPGVGTHRRLTGTSSSRRCAPTAARLSSTTALSGTIQSPAHSTSHVGASTLLVSPF